MTHRPLPWLLSLAIVGCTPDSKSVGAGESSGGADGSGTGSEASSDSQVSGSQSSSASASSTTVDPSDTAEVTTDVSTTSPGDPTESGGMTDPPSSSGTPGECDIFVIVEEAAQGKMEPIACGYVQLQDALGAWESAQECVLDNYAGEQAFTLVAEQQGIDSEVHVGFSGMQGEVYSSSRFHSDANGLVPGTLVTGGACNIVTVDGCTVEVGNLCLDCEGSPDEMTICETP